MTTWSYKNLDINMPAAILYDFEGKNCWQQKNEVTPWHGEIRRNGNPGLPHEIVLRFDCRGNEAILKTVLLTPLGDRWVGLDYACRRIELTQISRRQWYDACFGWH